MKMQKTRKTMFIFLIALAALLAFTLGAFAAEAFSRGDVSGDGNVTAEDARLALRAAVGLEHYAAGSKQFNAADADGDTGITASDARLILRAAVGLEDFSNPADPDTKVYVIDDLKDLPDVLGDLFNQERERLNEIGYEDYISEFFTCRVIVKTKDGSMPNYAGFRPSIVIDGPMNYFLFQFRSEDEAKSFQKAMEGKDDVVFAEPDQILSLIEPDRAGADSSSGMSASANSWGVSYIQADQYANYLVQQNYTGQIVVAVVDTGVDNSHPYLKNKLVPGFDFIDNDLSPYEGASGTGHGTHVSGTIIDCMPGLNVKIMPVRVLGLKGSGSTSVVAAGVYSAAVSGAKVINLSLGGDHSEFLDEAIDYAVSNGVTVCVAAGNESQNTSKHCPAHISTSGCICVAAIDSSGSPAYFSNYGNAVDVAAPGVSVKSCIPGGKYASWDGTSMATPHVSAVAAMYKLRNPSYSPSQIEQEVRKYVKDLKSSGYDIYTGYGAPQMGKAIPSTKYTLTVSKGTGISNVSGGGSYAAGATVTVSATVSSGYTWSKWTSSNTSLLAGSSSRSYIFTMPKGNVTLTASATQDQKYTLTVSKGTGISSVSGGGSYAPGATVTVSATVSSGYTWSKWTSSNTSLLAGSSSRSYIFTMPKGNVTLTASATQDQKYTLTVSKGTGISSVSGGGTYNVGDTVTVKATVSSGYTWSRWTSSNTSLLANSTSQNYSFKMPAGNVTLTATAASSVPSTKAEIINYYVAAYNRIGSEAKTVKRTYSSYTNYKNIVEIGNNGTIVNVVRGLMNRFMVEDETVFSGTVKDLPPKTVSTLSISTSQIDTATIRDNGPTYTIVLKSTGSDSNYEYNVQPGKGSAGVIGPLVDNNDIMEAAPKFTFTGLNTKYAKASVTATIDKATGQIIQLDYDTPCVVYCTTVSYPVLGIDVKVNNPQVGVEMKQTWKLTY